MIRGHFSCSRYTFGCLFNCVFLLLSAFALIPSVAGAQSAAETCREDGGHGDCTSPQIIDRPAEYTLYELRDPGSGTAAWSGFILIRISRTKYQAWARPAYPSKSATTIQLGCADLQWLRLQGLYNTKHYRDLLCGQ
jgi:hypothetical protein